MLAELQVLLGEPRGVETAAGVGVAKRPLWDLVALRTTSPTFLTCPEYSVGEGQAETSGKDF